MKILQINTVYKQGSTGNIVANIHQALNKNGFESYVAYGRGNWSEKNLIKIGSRLDLYIHGINTRIFDRHGLYSQKATKKLIKKIGQLDIDVFHLHNIHGYYLHYPTLLEYLKNKKIIWTFHDCWAYTGHCSYYDYLGCNKWQSQCQKCPQKNRYPASFIFDNSKNNFLLKKKYFTSLENLIIVTPSNWLANEVKKSFFKNYNIKVIPNGVNLKVFKPTKSSFRKEHNLENKFLILGVANGWKERKGFNYFLQLSHNLKDDEKIILVGLNNKQLKNLPNNIVGIKKTESQKKLAEIYSAGDVFVNLTLEDNFPTTNLESLACGTPVITFKSGGSPETINESCGTVIEKGNLKELYRAIRRIKESSKKNYINSCINRSEKYFNQENIFIKEYIKLYQN